MINILRTCVLFLIFAGLVTADEIKTDAVEGSWGQPIETPEQAVNLAWRYSGFDVFENLDIPESDRSARQFTK